MTDEEYREWEQTRDLVIISKALDRLKQRIQAGDIIDKLQEKIKVLQVEEKLNKGEAE